MSVSVLFARSDSVYKTFPGVEVYDAERDAKTFKGGAPVVAHPPCRAWGQLRAFAKPRPGEKELAVFAIEMVRKCGGVLEHPKNSTLWGECKLPDSRLDAEIDEYGGFTIHVDQFWWGHKARKSTKLYICGLRPVEVPKMPFKMGEPEYVCGGSKKRNGWKKEISKAEREHTPIEFAKWLVELASRCSVK